MDLALTCPTCSWIFVTDVAAPVPDHSDYLLRRCCAGVGASVFCIDVRPQWKRALKGARLAPGRMLEGLAGHWPAGSTHQARQGG